MTDGPAIGTSVGHYQILSKIGEGGMGQVYLARDSRLDRNVALKALSREFSSDKEWLERFVSEARATSALNHPNIITIFEVLEEDGERFIVSEFIDGRTLKELMRDEPPTINAALDIAIQIASALDAAHKLGIVHRDIKPANIMVRQDGIVKVVDFGIAKISANFPREDRPGDANDPNGPDTARHDGRTRNMSRNRPEDTR